MGADHDAKLPRSSQNAGNRLRGAIATTDQGEWQQPVACDLIPDDCTLTSLLTRIPIKNILQRRSFQ
jgi:hypothetical protein